MTIALKTWGSIAVGIVMLAAPRAQSAPPMFDGGRAFEHLREIVAFGPRPAGSATLAQTRRYITDQLAKSGIKATEQAFDADTPIGRIHMVNVIATLPGARPDRIVF